MSRICKATLDQVRTMYKEDDTLLRTVEEHNAQVQEIENALENRKEALRTNYGVNRRSVLTAIQGFHPVLSTPPDSTHDDFLGYCTRTS